VPRRGRRDGISPSGYNEGQTDRISTDHGPEDPHMSTVSTSRPAKRPLDDSDPFRYGWRYVIVREPAGTVTLAMAIPGQTSLSGDQS
jgi:hypothetical protein